MGRSSRLLLFACSLALCQLPHASQDSPDAANQRAEAGQGRPPAHGAGAEAPAAPTLDVTVDLTRRQPISPLLYGIFFEEVGHAGEGGLYAELVQDGSFDALAAATDFLCPGSPAGAGMAGADQRASPRVSLGRHDNASASASASSASIIGAAESPGCLQRLPVTLAELAGGQAQQAQRERHTSCTHGEGASGNRSASGSFRKGSAAGQHASRGSSCSSSNELVIAWQALPGSRTTLTREVPLNERKLVAMEVASSSTNDNFDGITSSNSSSSSSSSRSGGSSNAGDDSSSDGSGGGGSSSSSSSSSSSPSRGPVGIVNSGYWGAPVEAGKPYALSLYLRVPAGASAPANVTVALLPAAPAANGSGSGRSSGVGGLGQPLACATFSGLSPRWQRFTAELVSGTTDWQARLAVFFHGVVTLIVGRVSLFPSANAERGRAEGLLNPWPFRADLLGALREVQPRFLRFPGGCYVEGDWLAGAFRWKAALGRDEERSGHHNSKWGYWSTDGLGLFEYMLLAEELGAEPIWVVNNGSAHHDQVLTRDIWPWVQEALDGIEFIMGPPDSTWGRVRAAMGRPQPWRLGYVGIGNEGCGGGFPWDAPDPSYRPFYWHNYLVFYGALKAAYPQLRLVANCQLGGLGPADMWEYHVYTDPEDMMSRHHAFDGLQPAGSSSSVFASEYAVTEGGGEGNVVGAVAEAAFLLGLERNSHRGVLGRSYAPLLANANARPWPTNLIVFDNHRHFGIPSYHVQQMLSAHLGSASIETAADGPGANGTLAASASCLCDDCSEVALKLVNFRPDRQLITLRLAGLEAAQKLAGTAELLSLGSEQPLEENSFEEPTRVSPHSRTISCVAEQLRLPLEPWSLSILRLRIMPARDAAAS